MTDKTVRPNWRDETPEQWSHRVALVAVDALLHPGIVSSEQFEKATEIVAEEICARLNVRDYPPPPEPRSNDP